MLEQAVGEPARGGPHVQGYPTGHVQKQLPKGVLQLQSAPAHVPLTPQHPEQSVLGELLARLLHPTLTGIEDPPLHHQRLGLGSALGMALGH